MIKANIKKMQRKKIAIIGGSFDPPTLAHLQVNKLNNLFI